MVEKILDANEGTPAPSPEVVPEEQPGKVEGTPAGAETGAGTGEEQNQEPPFHEHPRWKEMLDKNRELESRINILQSERVKPSREQESTVQSARDKMVKRFVSSGWSEEDAQSLVDEQISLIKEEVSPLTHQTQSMQIGARISEFKKDHTDYDTLEPKMLEIFNGLSEESRSVLAIDPKGLEMLYNSARQVPGEPSTTPPRTSGIKGKSTKVPIKSGWTRKKIGELSMPEYNKYRDEILKAAASGEITE